MYLIKPKTVQNKKGQPKLPLEHNGKNHYIGDLNDPTDLGGLA